MMPRGMEEYLGERLPAGAWENRLIREGGGRFAEFGPTDVDRLARLGIEADDLGRAHFSHRPLGPLATGDQHRLGAPDRQFQPLGQRSRDHEQGCPGVDQELSVFAAARGSSQAPPHAEQSHGPDSTPGAESLARVAGTIR